MDDDWSGKKTPKQHLLPKDKLLWEQAMRDTKKLIKNKPKHEAEAPVMPTSYKSQRPLNQRVQEKFSFPRQNHTFLELGNMASVDGNVAASLKRGKYPVDRTIDLHGMTKEQAYHALRQAILSALASGGRCLLVITGKGKVAENKGGVIRASLASWLNSEELRPYILTFSHAAPKDGGTGAVYILLRRAR